MFCPNCGNQLKDDAKFCNKCGQEITTQSESAKVVNEFLSSIIVQLKAINYGRVWKKTRWWILGIIVIAGGGFASWKLFLEPQPGRNAMKAVDSYCNCEKTYYAEVAPRMRTFLSKFYSFRFTNRQQAIDKFYNEYVNPSIKKADLCKQEKQIFYNEMRNYFLTNYTKLQIFDNVYSTMISGCSPAEMNKVNLLQATVENKFKEIKNSEPDISKIKSDLIGQQIPGWRFASPSEFISASIVSKSKSNDRATFQVRMLLKDQGTNDEHECEVVANYLQNNSGWYFSGVRMMYITYTNTINVNQWRTVTPLKNCTYKIIDNGQRYWVQDGSYGSKYKGGPEGEQFYLKSNQLFLMSREDNPVDLIFKYSPNK